MSAHKLLPHQVRALTYATPRRRIALFMEMRLGKCVVTLRWAKHHGLDRVLLIAPLPTLPGTLNWEGELAREGLVPVALYATPKEARLGKAQWRWKHVRAAHLELRRERATGWFLANYEAVRVQPELLHLPWDAIVLDESTRVRNPRAEITKLLLKHTGHIRHRAILSGLPNPEEPLDFCCQFLFSLGQFCGFTDYWTCRQRLFMQAGIDWNWVPRKGTRERIKTFVHKHAFIATRRQEGIGSKKFYEMLAAPMVAAQKRAYREVESDFAYHGTETKWTPVVHTWLQKIAGGFTPVKKKPELISEEKLKLLQSVLSERLAGQSVVVWFRFNHEIDTCYHWLKRHLPELKVERVHGRLKRKSKTFRSEAQERFQAGKTRVILLQIALGKFGWNLSRANTAIYYSNSYEFEHRSQSEDRIIHVTKKDPVLYLDLVTAGSTDEDVVESLRDKKVNAKMFHQKLASAMAERLRRLAA